MFEPMAVERLAHMGDDLAMANAARVSFDKESALEDGRLSERDARLIRFLARNNHWTPFAHTAVTLRVKAPFFVARQLFKHKIGLVENEVSRRYVDAPPAFYLPAVWRERAPDKKQGSRSTSIAGAEWTEKEYRRAMAAALMAYRSLLVDGVAPEQARLVLPQSTMTEWWWTGSIAAFARVANLRIAEDAQAETREIAEKIDAIIEPLFPVAWPALRGVRPSAPA